MCLAEKYVFVEAIYPSTRDFCRDYLVECEKPDVSLSVSPLDVEAERKKSAEERRLEGLAPYEFPKPYLETLALYRKIAEALLPFGIILFHGSSLSMDGEGYVFTAKSGTGKSTHAAIWRKVFGTRVKMINDDKPLIGISGSEITVYGTPWCGKHSLGENSSAPLKSIAVLERSNENFATKMSPAEAYSHILTQTYRPARADAMKQVLSLLDKLVRGVTVCRLGVNMNDEAASVAYNCMKWADQSSQKNKNVFPKL